MEEKELKELVKSVVGQVGDEWLSLGQNMGVKKFGGRTHVTLQQTFPGLEGVMSLRVEELALLGRFIALYLKAAGVDPACQMRAEDVIRNEKNVVAGANQQGAQR